MAWTVPADVFGEPTARVRAVTDLRALFLCPILDNGGAERHWASLMPALAERGLGVRLVAIKGGGRAYDALAEAGVPVRSLGRSGLASATALPAVLSEHGGAPTVVVTFGYNAHVLGASYARLTGTPHVINWHRQQGWPMTRWDRLALGATARAGTGVIAVTGAQVADLEGLGFPQTRIRVVPNGVPAPADANVSVSTLRDRLGIPAEAFVAVKVARLRPEKRHVDFIDAIDRLRDRVPNTLGVIVGDGELTEDLHEYARARDAPVRFVGYQEVPTQWMLAADVVCLASEYEALPMALAEATACARPCVATNVGGATELVTEGENGFLFAPRDVDRLSHLMARLAENPAARHQMGRKSLERWHERFSFDAMADRYFDLLTAVKGVPASWS